MATGSQVNVAVNVNTTGLKEANKDAGQLHSSLKGAAEAAQKVRVSSVTQAAREAVKAEGRQYGVARGTVGTGAEGRDFAKQSQGLGGLVRVYATFAANLFAVSAAFGALSRAADTTNLIKGLDQLGAASGRALGGLSKQLAAASDGALSLRDAMQATAQASAAGMSNTAILRMGEAASKASQALGVAMPDAMSRLSRGITKLEPELLDELGIFVRVDKASQDYARSLGKSATSLTDFEKRQAFANAVLDQAEKKFGSIEINANPYAKLLASLQNIAQAGLELTNKVLTPLVNVLSSSPMALSAVLAGITGLLLKQAIPALGEYKKSLSEATTLAAKKAQESFLAQQLASGKQDDIVRASAINKYKLQQDYFKKVIDLENNAGQFTDSTRVKWSKKATQDVANMSAEELKSLSKRASTLAKTDKDQSDRLKKQIADIVEVQKIKQAAEAAGDAAQERRISGDEKFYSQQSVLQRNAISTGKEAAKNHIYNMAAQTQATLGASAAFKDLYANIKASAKGMAVPTGEFDSAGAAITRVGPASTIAGRAIMALSGTIRIAALSVAGVVSSFLPWLEIIGLAVTAIIGLVGWMSETKKEAAETSKALDSLTSALEATDKTLENINKKPLLEQLSVESVQAKATALNELVTATKAAVDKSNTELSRLGVVSGFTNWVSKLWSGDIQSKLNEKVSESVVTAFKALNQGPSAEQARQAASKILGFSVTNAEDVERGLSKMGDKGKAAIAQLLPELERLSQTSSVSAAKATELQASYTETNKTFNDFTNSLKASDTYSKLGEGMLQDAKKLDLALKDPTASLNAMLAVVSDVNNLRLFPESTAKDLLAYTDQIKQAQLQQANANQQLVQFGKEIEALEKSKTGFLGINLAPEKLAEIDEKIREIGKNKDIQIDVIANVQAKTNELKSVFEKAVLEQFKQGANVVSSRLAKDFAEASAVLKTGLAGMLGDTKAGIMLRAQYEKESLQVQNESIKQQINLATVTEKLAVEMELTRIESTKQKLEARGAVTSDAQYQKLLEQERKLKARQQDLNKPVSYKSVSQQMGSGAIPMDEERLAFLAKMEQGRIALAKNANQARLIDIKAIIELGKQEYAQAKKVNEEKSKGLAADKNGLDLLTSIAGFSTQESLQATQTIDAKRQQLDIDAQINDKNVELFVLRKVTNEFIKIGNSKAAAQADSEAKRVEEEKAALEDRLDKEKGIQTVQKDRYEQAKLAYEQDQKAQEHVYKMLELVQEQEQARLQSAEGLLSIQQEQALLTEKDSAAQKLALDLEKARLDAQQKADQISKGRQAALDPKLFALERIQAATAGRTLTPEESKATAAATAQLNKEIEQTNSEYDAQLTSLLELLGVNTKLLKVRGEFSKDQAARKQEREETDRLYEKLAIIKQIEQDRLSYAEALLNSKREFGIVTEEDYTREKGRLDLLKLQTDAQTRLTELARTRTERSQDPARIVGTLEAIAPAERTQAQNDQLTAQKAILDDIDDKYKLQISSIMSLLGLNTELSKTKTEQDLLQAKFNEQLKLSEQLTQSLTSAFGELGTALGTTITALAKMAQDEEKYLARRAQLEEDLKDPAKEAQATKDLQNLDKNRTKSELANISSVAAAGKKMFDEKSRGYKILTGIEKAASAVSAGLQAAELAQTIATTAKKIGIDIPAIYSSFMKWLGPFGPPAAAAAIAAFVGGAFGGGGGTAAMPTNFTAEDRQKTQGTGTVFGDSSAKTESIVNSLEYIQKYQFNNLEYSNKMLTALQAIKDNTEGLGKILVRIPGLSNVEASISGGNWLFGKTTSEVLDKGIKVVGTIGDAIASAAKVFTYKNTMSTDTGFLGLFGGGTSYGTSQEELNNRAVNESIASIFIPLRTSLLEAGTSLGVVQAGQTAGTTAIESLIDGITLSESFVISTMGLKGQELVDAIVGQVSAEMDRAAEAAFPYLEKFRNIGEGMSQTVVRVARDTEIVGLAFKGMGKTLPTLTETGTTATPEQLARQTTAQARYNSALAATKVARTVTVGNRESDYEVTIYGSEEATQALTTAQVELAAATKAVTDANNGLTTRNLDLTEALIKASGGIEAFNEQARFFTDNFLTDAERLAPVQERVTREMSRLGYSSVDTIEEFKNLVLGLDLTQAGGIETYASLMKVAPAFYDVAKAAQDTTEKTTAAAKAIADAKLDQSIRIYELLGNSEEALKLTRAKELDALDASLRPNQLYIYALQDQAALKTKLTAAYDKEKTALKNTISTIDSAIKSLKAYKDSLVLGSESPLTPAQRYQEARAQLDALRLAAQSTGTSEAEVAARNDAISKLPTASSSFLEASKILYASSEQYTQDFNSVLNLLDRTGNSLQSQKSVAEQQLEQLRLDGGFLESIEANTADFNTLLSQYITSQSAVNTARANYEASALTQTTSSTTAITNAIAGSSTANDAVTTTAATTVANAVTGTTSAVDNSATAITTAIINPTASQTAGQIAGDGGRDITPSGWSTMTREEQAAYYAENPTMGAITRGITSIVENTTLGFIASTIRDMIDPGARINDLALSYGLSSLGDGAPLGDNDGLGFNGPFAEGGLASSGWALVGERGPELVDFKTPGRVYSNSASAGLLNNEALIEEIRALRQEVAQLRSEQREQTGHIISTNYDANNRAASRIATATEDASITAAWKERSAVKLA